MPEKKQCGSCGADIYWLKSDATGKAAPIEVEPSERGNIAISEHSLYHIVHAEDRHKFAALHLNHFVTCPSAKVWAKRGGRR